MTMRRCAAVLAASAKMTRQTKQHLGSIVALLAVSVIGVVTWRNWPQRLPPVDSSTKDLVRFITTDRFANLPEEKKIEYVRASFRNGRVGLVLAAEEAHLSEEERIRGISNAVDAAIQVRWGQHLDAWLKLDQKGKQAYVKKIAAQMGPPKESAPPLRRGSGMASPDRQKVMIENTSPMRRAAMAEFMAAVQATRGGK